MSTTTALIGTSDSTVPNASFSLDHYEHMVECGAFAGKYEKRVELLWGRIVEMPPIGPPHSNDIDYLNEWSFRATQAHAIRVRIQNPIRLPASDSEPEPDVCWVREADYSKQHPNPEDVLLLIEVAESSLDVDRGSKLAAYAQAGIGDYWIVNLIDKQIEVYRDPSGLTYQQQSVYRGDKAVNPQALPAASLLPSRLFGA